MVASPSQFSDPILPRPNPLSAFASYSYSLSLYLFDIREYEAMIRTGVRDLSESPLLIQSGGINFGERHRFFDVDFYIDDLRMTSYIAGQGSMGAHNTATLNFQIREPYGISFINRLKAIAEERAADSNYTAEHYLLVIRFYGYDEAGNLITDGKTGPTTDPRAVTEKFIPFMWQKITFKVSNNVVVYDCAAVAPNYFIGQGTVHAVVPYNIEISGQTLQQLLGGNPVFAYTGEDAPVPNFDPDNLNLFSINNPTPEPPQRQTRYLEQGLTKALNDHEERRAAARGLIPNRYFISLDVTAGIADARMAKSSDAFKPSTPMGAPGTSAQLNQTSYDSTDRKYAPVAGQSIIQVLDLLIRNSTYITDQQLFEYSDDPTDQRNPRKRDSATQQPLWYKITTNSIPREFDPNRNEYAYDITYVVSAYSITDPRNEFFPFGKFRGTHKAYNYWFTGENSEIISFEQEFNSLYYLAMIPGALDEIRETSARMSQLNIKRAALDQTEQSDLFGSGSSSIPSSLTASVLYNPADQATLQMTVLGDPDWLQQNEIVYNNAALLTYDPYLPDGSVNYDSQEVLLQVAFNLPTDYDVLGDGTMNPITGNIKDQDELKKLAAEILIYRVHTVESQFTTGRFTQNLQGSLLFDLPMLESQLYGRYGTVTVGDLPPGQVFATTLPGQTAIIGIPGQNVDREDLADESPEGQSGTRSIGDQDDIEPLDDQGNIIGSDRDDDLLNIESTGPEQPVGDAASSTPAVSGLAQTLVAPTAGTRTAPLTSPPAGSIEGFSAQQTVSYLNAIGARESSNSYNAVNSLGFLGKYQFGAMALEDLGYIRPGASSTGRNIEVVSNPANWTGKDGVASVNDWLNNPVVQERAMVEYTNANRRALIANGGIRPGDDQATQTGMLAGAHLLGATGMQNWRISGAGTDAFGTTGREYFRLGQQAAAAASTG